MASFSFGAGNAAKLARIPLYLAGRLVTLLVPRTRDEWVFGSAVGLADGGWALWERASAEGERATWLTATPAEAREARARGIHSVPKTSIRGFWRTARARVIVVTHGFGDANRYAVSGAFVVQLWHGIPLKRVGLDSAETVRSAFLPDSIVVRRLLAMLYRGATSRIRLLPAASDVARGRLESAFGLSDDRVPVTGEPRVDVLSRGTADARRTAARAGIAALTGILEASTRVVLYAPTWRDGAKDPSVPDPGEWRRILRVLEEDDAVLLVRSHPLGEGSYLPPEPSPRVRHLGSDITADVTPLLPGLDVLITDYSSLAYDAGLAALPVVFLAADVEAYAASRGFYGVYADVAGADPARGWDDAMSHLHLVLTDEEERERRARASEALSRRVHAHRDGRNTERVYRQIRAGLGGSLKGNA